MIRSWLIWSSSSQILTPAINQSRPLWIHTISSARFTVWGSVCPDFLLPNGTFADSSTRIAASCCFSCSIFQNNSNRFIPSNPGLGVYTQCPLGSIVTVPFSRLLADRCSRCLMEPRYHLQSVYLDQSPSHLPEALALGSRSGAGVGLALVDLSLGYLGGLGARASAGAALARRACARRTGRRVHAWCWRLVTTTALALVGAQLALALAQLGGTLPHIVTSKWTAVVELIVTARSLESRVYPVGATASFKT